MAERTDITLVAFCTLTILCIIAGLVGTFYIEPNAHTVQRDCLSMLQKRWDRTPTWERNAEIDREALRICLSLTATTVQQ